MGCMGNRIVDDLGQKINRHTKLKTKLRKYYINIARDFCYGDDVIRQLKYVADDVTDAERILIAARHNNLKE